MEKKNSTFLTMELNKLKYTKGSRNHKTKTYGRGFGSGILHLKKKDKFIKTRYIPQSEEHFIIRNMKMEMEEFLEPERLQHS